ncbi:MAG: putative ABC exporter domain-containing protein [Pirellulales bacterium]
MHYALLLLSKLRLVGQCRKTKRAMSSFMGILTALVGVAFFSMIVLPRVLFPSAPREVFVPMTTWFFHPAALFGLWILTLVGSRIKSPLAFSMAEVEFLFAGPFTRRQLLVHKLLASTLGPLGFALLSPLIFPFVWWPAAIVGILLVATFMQWWTILLALAVDWIGARYRALRWAAIIFAMAAAVASFWQAGALATDMEIRQRLLALESSWASQIATAPFVPLSRVISATTVGSMLAWGAAALGMLFTVTIAILRLDAHFLEASLEASRRLYESLERLRRAGGSSGFRMRTRPRFTLPLLPRMLGAGTIAWRQALEIMRSSGGPIPIVVVPAVIGFGAAWAVVAAGPSRIPTAAVIAGVTLVVGFLITMSMPLGLRADLEHLDVLKTLPLGPNAVVWGSIVTAIGYVTVVQLVIVVSMATVLGGFISAAPLAAAAALPITMLSAAFDSVMVLLFPSIRRMVPGDPLVGVRILLVNLAKVVFAAVAAGIASIPILVGLLLDTSLAVPVAAGYGLLVGEGLATIWVAALLFGHYDPSAHLGEGE